MQYTKIRAASLFLFGVLVACHSDSHLEHNTLRRGLGGEPSTLDPALAADYFSTEVLRDLYEGLVAESPEGEIVPAIATTWKITPDARWSNGRPVRARDFVLSWQRVVDPKLASPVADDLRLIRGASEIIAGK